MSRQSGAANRWDLDGREGGMTAAGVGGPITGKGAHLLIVDDPIKNDEEARSSTFRARDRRGRGALAPVPTLAPVSLTRTQHARTGSGLA